MGRLHFQGVFIHIHAFGQQHAEAVDAVRHQLFRQGRRGLVAGLVAVIGNQCPFDLMSDKGLQQLIGKTTSTITGGDVSKPTTPQRHGIDQRFADNHRFGGFKRLDVPHADMRPWQVQVLGATLFQVFTYSCAHTLR